MLKMIRVFFLIMFVIGSPFYFFLNHIKKYTDFYLSDKEKILKNQDSFELFLSFLENLEPSKAIVMRQSEFLAYSKIPIIHIYDEQFFHLINSYDVKKSLESKKIKYIISNSYNDPSFYMTKIGAIIGNPSLSSLVFESKVYPHYQIYHLFSCKEEKHQWSNWSSIFFSKFSYPNVFSYYNSFVHKNFFISYPQPKQKNLKKMEILIKGEVSSKTDQKLMIGTLDIKKNYFTLKKIVYLKPGSNFILERFFIKNNQIIVITSKNDIQVGIFDFKYNINLFKKEREKPFFIKIKKKLIFPDNDVISLYDFKDSEHIILKTWDSSKEITVGISGEGILCQEYDKSSSFKNIFLYLAGYFNFTSIKKCFIISEVEQRIQLENDQRSKKFIFYPYLSTKILKMRYIQ